MIIRLLSVGSAKGPVAEAAAEFEKRARRYWRMEAVEVQAGAAGRGKAHAEAVMAAEEARLLERLPKEGWVVALTRSGRRMTSRELARHLEEKAVRSVPVVSFVIGGAFGLGEGILRRADLSMTLSSLTLPHEVARLLLAEQLYRAGTILRNEPYHKGP
ncbi:MAG: 23S rRNA (pseudouridine(1915)-N(3))-methyltransferase RlmH [Gemmatimonadota bacterium]